jgi:hypothetical protein
MKPIKTLGVIACLLVCGLVPSTASIRLDESNRKLPAGRIVGSVVDAYDARVSHAKVRVESGSNKWEGETDEAGDFSAELPPGSYRIYVKADGFRAFESAFLKVKSNVSELMNIHLEVMAIIDMITIEPQKKKP